MQSYQTRVFFVSNLDDFTPMSEVATELITIDTALIGIDEIRSLIQESHRRPQSDNTKKAIFLKGASITVEAQQAALKILEEPPEAIELNIVLPTGTQLLSTVHSRVQFVQEESNEQENDVLSNWLALPYGERVAEVDRRVKAQDTNWLQTIKQNLQVYSRSHGQTDSALIRTLDFTIHNLLNRGSSNKMLLEHLALTLPLTR